MTVLTIPNRPRQASPTSRQQCPLPRQRPPTPRSHQRQQTDPAARASILDLARVLRGPSRRRRTTARCPTCPRTQTKRRGCQLHVHTVRNHHTGAPQKAGETETRSGVTAGCRSMEARTQPRARGRQRRWPCTRSRSHSGLGSCCAPSPASPWPGCASFGVGGRKDRLVHTRWISVRVRCTRCQPKVKRGDRGRSTY